MIYKAYKYRIYPTNEQKEKISMHIGCSRYIYNYGLDLKIKSYHLEKKTISRFDIQKNLPILKRNEETKWLQEVNSQTLQSSLENLDKAFTRFFRDKQGFPKFKSKHNNNQSFNIPQYTKVNWDDELVFIPKFKNGIKVRLHRSFDGTIKTSTISKTPTGKYYISILVETNQELPKKKLIVEKQAVGIDLGIKTFAVLSNGMEIQNPKYLKKAMSKLKYTQSRCSRYKGKKRKQKLALLHEKVSNKRNDFLNKTSNYLVTNFDTICLETLKVSNMMKNHKLAQSFSDISIGKFNEMINYKAEWNGTNVLRIGQFEPSSKLCTCGVKNMELKLSDRIWTCKSCNTTHDRDVLASNNIKLFAFINLSTEHRLKNRNELSALVEVMTSEATS